MLLHDNIPKIAGINNNKRIESNNGGRRCSYDVHINMFKTSTTFHFLYGNRGISYFVIKMTAILESILNAHIYAYADFSYDHGMGNPLQYVVCLNVYIFSCNNIDGDLAEHLELMHVLEYTKT